MPATTCPASEDQFLCFICLDVINDPVTSPCGRNFCKTCIVENRSTHTPCECSFCNEDFYKRPQLQVNSFIFELAAQFRQSAQQRASSRMCSKHDKLLELFCKTDQMSVCMLCSVTDHKTHDVVPLKDEYKEKKAELGKTDAEIQQMIQKRRLKIQEIKRSVELSKKDGDREIADGVQVFTALKESVERSQGEFINTIKEKQRKTERQAEGFITELEQEISELKKRSSELEQLSRSEDHLHLLQNFPSLNTAPPTKTWTGVSVRPPSYEGTVVRAVNQLEQMFSDHRRQAELRRLQQSAVDLSRYPDAAHSELNLSDDGKQVKCVDARKKLPDNRKRFDPFLDPLSLQEDFITRFSLQEKLPGLWEWPDYQSAEGQ